MAIYLVSPEHTDIAQAIVENEFLPQLESELVPDADDPLAQPVSDLVLSARAKHCMKKLGVTTIGDLVQLSAEQLLAVKTVGQTTLDEICQELAALGLKLSGD